ARALVGRAPTAVVHAREDDVFLYSAALAFYGLVSVAPLVVVALWVTSLLVSDSQVHQVAEDLGPRPRLRWRRPGPGTGRRPGGDARPHRRRRRPVAGHRLRVGPGPSPRPGGGRPGRQQPSQPGDGAAAG